MSTNPRLDFFRFELNHKSADVKTFTNFAIDELKARKNVSSEKVVELCFEHFIKSLDGKYSKDENLEKQLTLIKKKSANKHLDKRPVFDSDKHIIYGVINGGPFGRDRIVSDVNDPTVSESLSRNNSVLQYFYFILYLPPDHNEGCLIVHSNSSDESVAILFRNFIGHIFKGTMYNKATTQSFCPQSFQDEFRKGAIIDRLSFKTTFVEDIPRTNPLSDLLSEYDIKIEAVPRKGVLAVQAEKVRDFFASKLFGTSNKGKSLSDFDRTTITLENDVSNKKKVFEWNTRDQNFVPVVYLQNRISKTNEDGTPDFNELQEFCHNIFFDEVLPELRPDKSTKK